VLQHVRDHGPLPRTELLRRFRNDDDATLRGVLNDMVEGGVLYASGSGDTTFYRATDERELPATWKRSPEQLAHLVWVAVYRFGPLGLAELQQIVPDAEESLLAALKELLTHGRIAEAQTSEGVRYESLSCFIPVGSDEGWEAAVFDHYQAVVTAICNKLQYRALGATSEAVGGSTYRFTVWPGHPHREEVRGLLSRLRTEAVRLRESVESYNSSNDPTNEDAYEQFVAYLGQTQLFARSI
jgi:hypothetical protein